MAEQKDQKPDLLADNENDDEETRQRKRKERLEQNRISARESRKRKKSMIEELQRTVITLSRENKDLNERNESLRRQLMEIASKYPNVVPLQAIMGQTPAPPAAQPTEIANVVAGATSSIMGQPSAAPAADAAVPWSGTQTTPASENATEGGETDATKTAS